MLVEPSVAVEFLEQQQDAAQAEWCASKPVEKIATQLRALRRALRYHLQQVTHTQFY